MGSCSSVEEAEKTAQLGKAKQALLDSLMEALPSDEKYTATLLDLGRQVLLDKLETRRLDDLVTLKLYKLEWTGWSDDLHDHIIAFIKRIEPFFVPWLQRVYGLRSATITLLSHWEHLEQTSINNHQWDRLVIRFTIY